VENLDGQTWRAHITKAHTLALVGKRAIIRITGTSPELPNEPDIEEGILKVLPV
jgi:hypothetical protein